jgi:hypothetical protein
MDITTKHIKDLTVSEKADILAARDATWVAVDAAKGNYNFLLEIIQGISYTQLDPELNAETIVGYFDDMLADYTCCHLAEEEPEPIVKDVLYGLYEDSDLMIKLLTEMYA